MPQVGAAGLPARPHPFHQQVNSSYQQGRSWLCALGPELPTDSLRSFGPNAQQGKCRRWEQLAFQPVPVPSTSR